MPPSGTRRRLLSLGRVALLLAIGGLLAFLYSFQRNEVAAMARAEMRSDLLVLAHAESLYFASHRAYAVDLPDLRQIEGANWVPRSEVTLTIDQADPSSWHATATHRRASQSCTLTSRQSHADEGPQCQ